MFWFGLKVRKILSPVWEVFRPGGILSYPGKILYLFFRSSTSCMRPTHLEEGDLLIQLTIQMPVPSRNVLVDPLRIRFN